MTEDIYAQLESNAIVHEADYLDGWEAMQEMMQEDELWAQQLFQGYGGHGYEE